MRRNQFESGRWTARLAAPGKQRTARRMDRRLREALAFAQDLAAAGFLELRP